MKSVSAREAHFTDDPAQEFLGVTRGIALGGIEVGVPQIQG